MSLNNMGLVSGGTISVAGGSAVTFSPKSTLTNGTLEVAVAADSDFRLRRTASFKVVNPASDVSKPNGYTQAKAIATFRKPKLLANGKYTTNSVQISLFYDPETTDAEKQELMDFAAQLAFDADCTAFWKTLSVY